MSNLYSTLTLLLNGYEQAFGELKSRSIKTVSQNTDASEFSQ